MNIMTENQESEFTLKTNDPGKIPEVTDPDVQILHDEQPNGKILNKQSKLSNSKRILKRRASDPLRYGKRTTTSEPISCVLVLDLDSEEMVTGIDKATKESLLKAAFAATERAYCPYSNFRVGAALLTESGTIITGGNVENASYGATICAERSAFVRAIAEGHKKFKAIAIATHAPTPATPCGICRQFMFEFGDMPVYLTTSKNEKVEVTSVKELLPGGFGPNSLDEFYKSR